MRALAEWIMHGPAQARVATVALVSAPLLLVGLETGAVRILAGFAATVLVTLSAAAVGLVTLRKGLTTGVGLMAWALLPGAVWLVWRDESSPLVLLLSTTLLAGVLRQTASWPRMLVAASALGMAISVVLGVIAPDTAAELRQLAQQMTATLGQSDPQLSDLLTPDALYEVLLGGLVAGHLGSALTSLLIARWWQALLFNPGGLRAEFHQLRLPRLFAVAALVVLIAGGSLSQELLRWLPVVVLPLMLAGVALVHGVVAKRDLGRSWLIAFYAMAFLAGPYLLSLLILLAVADSFVDIRGRIAAKS